MQARHDQNEEEIPDVSGTPEPEDQETEIRDTDILFECPQCGKSMVVDYRGAGLTIPCVDCKQPVEIPIPEGMDVTDLDSSTEDQGVRVIQMRELLADAQRKILQQDDTIEGLRDQIERIRRDSGENEKRLREIRWETENMQRSVEKTLQILNDARE